MKPIFSRGPSLQIRLAHSGGAGGARHYYCRQPPGDVQSNPYLYGIPAVSPFYFVSNAPRELLDGVSQTLASRDQLELENRALRQELLLKNS